MFAFKSKKLATGEKLFKRFHGIGELTLLAGEVGDFEFEVPYTWCKLEAVEIMDQTDKLAAELYIEDATRAFKNIFGIEVNVAKVPVYEKRSSFDVDLYLDMWVVLQVTNTSLVTQTMRVNIELDEVKANE